MTNFEEFEPGTVLRKRYEIVQVVGKGGMGKVYQARDTKDGGMVAVKELLPIGLDKQQAQEAERQFQQEAHMLKQLKHPNLPRFYDSFSENGRSFFVMEFIDGKTLAQLVADVQSHQLPVDQVEQYALQLCKVLGYLHTRKKPIIFRDLTPKNVMIVSSSGEVKLIDFGIARFFKPGQEEDTVLSGTPGFISPELLNEGKTVPHSDQFSLGATLHFCLTGHHPKLNRPSFHFPPVRQYNQSVPDSLNRFILQLVATEVENRFPDMQDALHALGHIRQDAATTTLPLTQVPTISSITTVPDIQVQRANAISTMGKYYNPEKAWLAQFRFWQKRMRHGGGLRKIWTWAVPALDALGRVILSFTFNQFLPLCRTIGDACLRLRPQLRQKQAQPRPVQPPTPPPAPTPPPVSRPQRLQHTRMKLVQFSQRARIPQIAMLQPGQIPQALAGFNQQRTIRDAGIWLICLAFLALASFYLLHVLHSSFHSVTLLLSLVLLLLTAGISALWNKHLRDEASHYQGNIQRDEQQNAHMQQNEMVHYLLAAIEFIVFLFCLTLFVQPDVQKVIVTATPGKTLSFILISFALMAMVRPATHFRWSDCVAIACAALSAILLLQNINLSIPFLAGDPSFLINVINIFLALIILCALISVIFYHPAVKKTFIFLLSIVFLGEQILLGTPEIGVLLHWNTSLAHGPNSGILTLSMLNLLVASLPLVVTFCALRISDGTFIVRLSLAVLVTGYALLLWFQGSTAVKPGIVAAPPYLPLATQLTVFFANNLLVIGLLLFLALAMLLRLLIRSGRLQWDFLALFALAFSSGLLQLAFWQNQPGNAFPLEKATPSQFTIDVLAFNTLLADALFVLFAAGIVLIALSLMLHLVHALRQKSPTHHRQTTPGKTPVASLDMWLIRVGKLLLFLTTLVCTILQWTAGTEEAFYGFGPVQISAGLTLSLYHYILALLCLLTLIVGGWCLSSPRETDREEDSDEMRYERSFPSWVFLLIGFEALVEVLILFGTSTKQPIIIVKVPDILILSPAFLSSLIASTGWMLLLLLPIIVAIQFSWLKYPFSHWIRRILPCILVVALLSASLQFVFPLLAPATLIFLIAGILLVARQLPSLSSIASSPGLIP